MKEKTELSPLKQMRRKIITTLLLSVLFVLFGVGFIMIANFIYTPKYDAYGYYTVFSVLLFILAGYLVLKLILDYLHFKKNNPELYKKHNQ